MLGCLLCALAGGFIARQMRQIPVTEEQASRGAQAITPAPSSTRVLSAEERVPTWTPTPTVTPTPTATYTPTATSTTTATPRPTPRPRPTATPTLRPIATAYANYAAGNYDLISLCELAYAFYEESFREVNWETALQHSTYYRQWETTPRYIPYNRQFDCVLAMAAISACSGESTYQWQWVRTTNDVYGCVLRIMTGPSDELLTIHKENLPHPEEYYWRVP